jgi:hypothetical protein
MYSAQSDSPWTGRRGVLGSELVHATQRASTSPRLEPMTHLALLASAHLLRVDLYNDHHCDSTTPISQMFLTYLTRSIDVLLIQQ